MRALTMSFGQAVLASFVAAMRGTDVCDPQTGGSAETPAPLSALATPPDPSGIAHPGECARLHTREDGSRVYRRQTHQTMYRGVDGKLYFYSPPAEGDAASVAYDQTFLHNARKLALSPVSRAERRDMWREEQRGKKS